MPAQVLWLACVLPWRQAAVRAGLAGAVALAWYAPWIPVVATLPERLPWAWRTPVNPYWLVGLLTSQTFGTYLFDTGSYFTIGHVPFQTYPVLLFPFVVLLAIGAVVLRRVNGRAGGLLVRFWLLPIALVSLVSIVQGLQFAFPPHLEILEPFAALLLAAGIVHAGGGAARAPPSDRAAADCGRRRGGVRHSGGRERGRPGDAAVPLGSRRPTDPHRDPSRRHPRVFPGRHVGAARVLLSAARAPGVCDAVLTWMDGA